ncbi:MAG: TIGR03936 family radical SAM-associated protein [Lachnospiraceae bacterium]|nr:TIGR03936 family radical SAM-associated protein [Lachnospiraceae bacterium]
MNIRIKFRKYGCLKFIGHLDVMRYFQKAMRRAEIDICFSEGFSPHMIMSFAAPLGVGLTSEGEYVDIAVKESLSSKEAVQRLNAVMAEGIDVVSWRLLPDTSKNAMSIVAAADYEVRFREGYEPEDGWKDRFQEFLALSEIQILKETKRGHQEVDIRPWIYDCHLEGDVIIMQVSTGSVHNLKPELLMKSFGDWAGIEIPPFALLVHRKEIYADLGNEHKRKLVTLEALGEEIG